MKRLGRGLGSILEDVEIGYLKDIGNSGVLEIDVDKIKPNPYQPRKEFKEESIIELANSIKRYGLLQPVILIRDKDEYILVVGERRLKAVKKLNKDKIKAIIVDYSLNDLREYALIENIQREDLNPIEIAISLSNLIKEHNYTHEELANIISKSRSYVTNLLRVLNLPNFVQNKIRENKLSIGHAKVLIGLDENLLKEIVEEIEKRDLNVRETEKLIQRLKNPIKNKDIITNEKLILIAKKFKESGFKVEVNRNSLKIKFKTEQDLKKLEEILNL